MLWNIYIFFFIEFLGFCIIDIGVLGGGGIDGGGVGIKFCNLWLIGSEEDICGMIWILFFSGKKD